MISERLEMLQWLAGVLGWQMTPFMILTLGEINLRKLNDSPTNDSPWKTYF